MLPGSNQELANQLGTVREVISRNLMRLQAEGLLEVDARQIVIKDVRGLTALLEAARYGCPLLPSFAEVGRSIIQGRWVPPILPTKGTHGLLGLLKGSDEYPADSAGRTLRLCPCLSLLQCVY